MGIFDRLRRRDTTSETTVTPEIDDVLLKALVEKDNITREKALMLPAVSGAVDLIGNAVACMPVALYKRTNGKVERVEDDPRVRMLNGDTGDTLDAFQMKKAIVEDYLLGKGGYAYIARDRNTVTGLYYVKDTQISFSTNSRAIYKDYIIYVDGEVFESYDFLKVLRNTKDGASGCGLTAEVAKALETAYNTMLYQLALVKSGGNKKGFLKTQHKLGQQEIDVLKNAWRNLYQNNSESVVVLNNGLEFQEASNSSVEMQLNESKNTLTSEINNIFHISSDFDETFKQAIYPIIKAFETALNRDLLLEREKSTMYFAFDVREITKASIAERYAAYKVAKETGFLTINEIRAEENRNYIEGMDVINVGLGSVLYDVKTGKYYTPNTGETQSIDEAEPKAELPEARDVELRYNHNHDGKTGRFTGGGIGSVTTFTDSHGTTVKFRRAEGKEFKQALIDARASQPVDKRWRVDAKSYNPVDYDGMQCYITEKGSVVAIKPDGCIISVCTKINPETEEAEDRGRSLMEFAFKRGGTHGDSYEGNYEFYKKCGMTPVSRCDFDTDIGEKFVDGWKEAGSPKEIIIGFVKMDKPYTKTIEEFRKETPKAANYDIMEAQMKEVAKNGR